MRIKSAGRARFKLGARAAFGASLADLGDKDLAEGWNELSGTGTRLAELELGLTSTRADLPAAAIGELRLEGSPVGPKLAVPRLVLTYPTPTRPRAGTSPSTSATAPSSRVGRRDRMARASSRSTA